MSLPTTTVPSFSVEIPSTKETIRMRPFLVKEEKILLMALESENDNEIKNATLQILSNCIMTEGVDCFNLPIFDIEYLFLQLRAKSVSEIADPYIVCEECSKPIEIRTDLSKVKVDYSEEEKHTNNILLEDDGKIGIILKYPTLKTAFENNIVDNLDGSFEILVSCIDSIYTEEEVFAASDHTQEELIEFVENLTSDQFEKILSFYKNMPSVRHVEDCECSECGHKFKVEVRGIKDFFT